LLCGAALDVPDDDPQEDISQPVRRAQSSKLRSGSYFYLALEILGIITSILVGILLLGLPSWHPALGALSAAGGLAILVLAFAVLSIKSYRAGNDPEVDFGGPDFHLAEDYGTRGAFVLVVCQVAIGALGIVLQLCYFHLKGVIIRPLRFLPWYLVQLYGLAIIVIAIVIIVRAILAAKL
jgi:hypothetical protein